MKLNVQEIEDIVGADNVSITDETRALYARDISSLPGLAGQIVKNAFKLVVQPVTMKSLIALIKYTNEKGIPIVPRGSGTSGWGGALPIKESICISMIRMSRIRHVDEYGLHVTVEAGITWRELLMFLEQAGLTLPVYPSSAAAATVGGFVASGGFGIGSAKHGNIKSQVTGIEAILPNGMLVRAGSILCSEIDDLDEDALLGGQWLGRMVQKDTSLEQTDLLELFMETYGTFGLITKVSLRVIPKLMFRAFAGRFDTMESMMNVVSTILEHAEPYHMRFITDSYSSKVFALRSGDNEFGKFILSGALMNTIYELEEEVELITRVVHEHGGVLLSDGRAEYHWSERFYPLRIKNLGPSLVPAEAILPISSVTEMYDDTIKALGRKSVGIEGTIGNNGMTSFLAWILDDERKTISYTLGWHRSFDLARLAKNHGGKPYAVALWNVPYAREFYGDNELDKLAKMKQIVDPKNLMNPMKVFGGRIEAGKESQAFGFLSGYMAALLVQMFGPTLLGWSWLSDILWTSTSSQIILPIIYLISILGGIAGFLFIRFLSLRRALKLGIPLLKIIRKILRLK
ncbi:MAG: FAD-binding oxidoreductase [Candidatus Thorarchaeota archaeon]|nr:FAD-binding oxidoreductase [Candidatus Thorarchaeota archaeon]